MIGFYLVTTDALERRLWFRDEDDFKVGMNLVALLSALTEIRVLAFILMSNHVHFVFQCSYEEALDFITELKNLYSRYVYKKYEIKELLRKNGVDIREVFLEDESLEKAIAYVQMNSVAANICLLASDYPWGSGACFFRLQPVKGVPVVNLTQRKFAKIFHSRQDIPNNGLMLGENGYVEPSSFVQVGQVEAVFKTPKRMNYFLHTSSKARRRLEADSSIPAFRDQVVASALNDLSTTLFQASDFSILPEEAQSEILKQLRYRFSANIHQLSRVSNVEYERVARMLDSI